MRMLVYNFGVNEVKPNIEILKVQKIDFNGYLTGFWGNFNLMLASGVFYPPDYFAINIIVKNEKIFTNSYRIDIRTLDLWVNEIKLYKKRVNLGDDISVSVSSTQFLPFDLQIILNLEYEV